MITSDQSSFTRAEPMGDEALAALRSLAQAGITPTPTATLSLLARLDATHDTSTILARDLDDALSRLHRAEKDRDAKAGALSGFADALHDRAARAEATLSDYRPDAPAKHFVSGKANAFREAERMARQALTTPSTEEEAMNVNEISHVAVFRQADGEITHQFVSAGDAQLSADLWPGELLTTIDIRNPTKPGGGPTEEEGA